MKKSIVDNSEKVFSKNFSEIFNSQFPILKHVQNFVAILSRGRYYECILKNVIIVQTFLSQSKIDSLPVSQKSATFFENPLDRPEIASSEANPMIPPRSVPVQETESLSNISRKSPLIIVENTNIDAAVPARRKLPDEIKAIFETTSKNFSDYAKNNGEKNDTLFLEKADTMDQWDRALLLAEYPPAVQERPKPNRVSFVPAVSVAPNVPKKSDKREIGTEFPSRVMDKEVAPPVRSSESATPVIPQKPKNAAQNIPEETANKKGVMPPVLSIPVKPKQSDTNSIRPMSFSSPTPPLAPGVSAHYSAEKPILVNQIAERPAVPPPNMSETLVEKIIEGQMRGVFENAPPLIQKELEKISVSEILAAVDEKILAGGIENEVWKKRLREYLLKLQGQAGSVSQPAAAQADTFSAHPLPGEQVLDYVKRVYPIILKAQVLKP